MVGTGYLAVNTEVRSATLAVPGGVDYPASCLIPHRYRRHLVGGLQAAGLTQGTTLFNQFIRDAQTASTPAIPISYADRSRR